MSRTAKVLADSGEATTFADAEATLRSYVLQLHLGRIAGNATLQAAALTVVNSAARAFWGGVRVEIEEDCEVVAGWHTGSALSAAIEAYGGTIAEALAADTPTVCVGTPSVAVFGQPILRAVATGWTAGVVTGIEAPFTEIDSFVPAGVAAGGIAVAEAFEYSRGANIYPGRRSQGFSLWQPGVDWLRAEAVGPGEVTLGPSAWWIVGLGHLGQGFLWSIGMLPYAEAGQVHVVLQDDDVLTQANESTGLLLSPGTVVNQERRRKTRELAAMLEGRGFRTTITERRLRAGDGPTAEEPRLALIGVDNPLTRRGLSATTGFSLIIDVGLGSGPRHYLDMQLRTFPAMRRSDAVPGWQEASVADLTVRRMPAYAEGAQDDDCGMVELAGRSVAAAFVGATAGALAVAEAERALRGEHRHEVVSATLHDLRGVQAVVTELPVLGNLGFAPFR